MVRVSRQEMEKSHRRIVDGAARLVRQRGIERTSVADVMSEAGLTNGGFYRHFKTREAMIEAAIDASFEDFCSALEARFQDQAPENAVAGYKADYLSMGHVEQPARGCPISALGGDVGHESQALKQAFGKGVRRAITSLAQGIAGTGDEKRAAATRELAMLVGAVVMARASDPETAERVLKACREDACSR
ncbi:MAG: TetR/AcrR family transcriptional regulator [Beijerinckiaceae bacterium]|nr:TetR/AcrR family transcriptional regulator [Beijerinckiaceae bacterium]